MKRNIILVGTITLVLSICCAVAIAVGRSQPNPTLSSFLGYCNQDPCLLGIVPGKTSWIDARTRFPEFASEDYILVQFDTHTQAYFVPSEDYRVKTEGVNFDPGSGPSLGTLISIFGAPCAVTVPVSGNGLGLVYRNIIASVNFAQKQTTIRLTPQLKVDTLLLQNGISSCDVGSSFEQSWLGFTGYTSHFVP